MSQHVSEDKSGRESEAEYTLEYAARCPHCENVIEVVNVSRLLRTKINFTSTLPRRGHVLICSQCNTIIAAEISRAI